VTSSWFFLSTLNYDARSTTHQIYTNHVRAHVVMNAFSKTGEVCKVINAFCKNVENCILAYINFNLAA